MPWIKSPRHYLFPPVTKLIITPAYPNDELLKIIDQYNVLIVRSETEVNAELISRMDNMEIIGRAGAGTDNIDIKAATRKGIIVMNTPGGNTVSAAEHTIALMLSLCRNIPQASQSVKEGKWERKNFKGIELFGKTLGIIGLGKIGREVASRCKAFGMEIIGYDPLLSGEASGKLGVKAVDIDMLFRSSDIITIHVPLTPETKYLISKENLKKCKEGVRIINCARGGIVSEKDLLDAVTSGLSSGAALDVFENEPPDPNGIVSSHKIIVTPHLGASTVEAQEKVAVQIADQIINYFKSGLLQGGVNTDSIISVPETELSSFMDLAEKVGKLHSQLLKGNLKCINMHFSGNLLHSSIPVLKSSFLKGLLSPLRSEPINLVNAPSIAAESGIIMNEIKSGENSPYNNLLEIICESTAAKNSISGTVFRTNDLRIVGINGFPVEFKPEGSFIIYRNIDQPGILAGVTGILAEAEINIGTLSLGRDKVQKEALTIISVDGKITNEIKNLISVIKGIKQVQVVHT